MIRYMMMLLLLAGVASPFIGAQETIKHFEKDRLPTNAWIFLQNGELINGVITKDDGSKVTLTNKHFKNRRIDYSEIEKTAKGRHKVSPASKGKFHYDEGMFFTGFVSFNLAGESRTGSWQSILGTRPNKHWAVGGGGSLDWYRATFGDINNESLVFMSAFAYGRYNLTHKRARVYLYSRLGYGMGLDGNVFREVFSDGINFHPGIGLTFASRNVLRWVIEIGMRVQNVNGDYVIRDPLTMRDITATYKNLLMRPILKIGFDFH